MDAVDWYFYAQLTLGVCVCAFVWCVGNARNGRDCSCPLDYSLYTLAHTNLMSLITWYIRSVAAEKTSSLHECEFRTRAMRHAIFIWTSFVQKLAGVKSIGLCGRGCGAIVKGTCANPFEWQKRKEYSFLNCHCVLCARHAILLCWHRNNQLPSPPITITIIVNRKLLFAS